MVNVRQPIDAERIERAARCLSSREREVLVLSASEIGLETVGERLGLSIAEVERLLADALCKLDRALERQERPWWRFW